MHYNNYFLSDEAVILACESLTVTFFLSQQKLCLMNRDDVNITITKFLPYKQLSAETREQFFQWWINGNKINNMNEEMRENYRQLLKNIFINKIWEIENLSNVKTLDDVLERFDFSNERK